MKYAINVVLCCIAFFLGVVSCNWSYFEMKKEIGVFEMASLLVTSGFGFFIAYTLQKQQASDRSEKDFVISEIKKCFLSIEKLSNYCNNNSYPFTEVKILLKQINLELRLAYKIAKRSPLCASINFQNTSITKVRQLRQAITAVSQNSQNNIVLDVPTNSDVRTKIDELVESIYEAIFKVNNL